MLMCELGSRRLASGVAVSGVGYPFCGGNKTCPLN